MLGTDIHAAKDSKDQNKWEGGAIMLYEEGWECNEGVGRSCGQEKHMKTILIRLLC